MLTRKGTALILALGLLAALVAVPALAADPAPSGPGRTDKPDKPGRPAKVKVEKTPISLSGTIAATTDADRKVIYTIQTGGVTYVLDAGPPWFFGDNHPLKPHVGKSVSVSGEKAADSNEVDVKAINGTALRAEGKPPWAGGWKRVGQAHPGWSQEKADRMKAKFGDCFPPGHCKSEAKPAATAGPAS
jgi:hypothetical protein